MNDGTKTTEQRLREMVERQRGVIDQLTGQLLRAERQLDASQRLLEGMQCSGTGPSGGGQRQQSQ